MIVHSSNVYINQSLLISESTSALERQIHITISIIYFSVLTTHLGFSRTIHNKLPSMFDRSVQHLRVSRNEKKNKHNFFVNKCLKIMKNMSVYVICNSNKNIRLSRALCSLIDCNLTSSFSAIYIYSQRQRLTNKGNNKITEHRAILQRECQNS